ncbi:RNA methyltransferase [Blastomyces gilchristii SLH14081]|uniref:rRNA methyltransferase 1, mitochondrial n=1 Tax=Blastomyces gilchristii (strain SLH14081) TaxID=559298 RepID=A0A179UNI5_BLAGS|nr:RNA methyltransferase [Blastomyces gilchristii SLH14081]OAT08657.1 RNA methyltransferase [Blastomyces gilchristii SLH14081]
MLNRHCSALLKSHRLCFAGLTELNFATGTERTGRAEGVGAEVAEAGDRTAEEEKAEGEKEEGEEEEEAKTGTIEVTERAGTSTNDRPSWDRRDFQRRDEDRSGDWLSSNESNSSRRKNRHERNAEKLAARSEQTEFNLERPPHTRPQVSITAPRAIPYTTAASEFIYGASAVLAALRCGRRKLYKLYIYDAPDKVSLRLGRKQPRDPMLDTITKFGLAAGVHVKQVAGNWPKLLDKMSGGRPHNGCILEASQLPKLPVDSLLPVASLSDTHFNASVCQQSAEEAEVNGTSGRIPRWAYKDEDCSLTENVFKPSRYPFALLLDGIRDEGNVGAIIRSAYYFGVDSIIVSTRNSAPISAVVIKASAGAAENIPILTTTNPTNFLKNTRMNGWKIFAAEAPAAASASQQTFGTSNEQILSRRDVSTKLSEAPCILMLGSEDQGLQRSVRQQADGAVVIPGAITLSSAEDRAGVDSLNVSVASALLCEAFLGDPSSTGQGRSPAEGMMSTVDMIREEVKEDPNKMF